ncbi:MAG: sulfatase [Spirulina sp. SIO3F2]|nr:sulfatase [Spirulina sp. SIO3F2]
MVNRRRFLLYGSTALIAALLRSEMQAASPPPNVLWLTIDDLNDWIGVLGGHPQTQTPNIDRLARRGTLFTQAYCAVPACNPSRVATLTGIAPQNSGVYANRSDWRVALPDTLTLPQLFKANGYWVGGAGKIYHDRFPDCTDWDEYYPYHRYQDGKPRAGAWGADPEPPQRPFNGVPKSRNLDWGSLDIADTAMPDTQIAAWTVEKLQARYETPFFLACGLFKPHLPWYIPATYFEPFPLDSLILPEIRNDDLDDIPPAGQDLARQYHHQRIMNAGSYAEAVQAYLAAIAYVDAQVGRILDGLDRSPHARNTVVVLWSDHGWHLGEKLHWTKFALWEEATRVPLIIALPNQRGQSCDRVVSLLDLYPTLAELCQLTNTPVLSGTSLVPWLQNPRRRRDVPAVMLWENHVSVRWEQYRYTRYQDGSEEFYDHRRDPQEWENLAGNGAIATLQQDLAAWVPTQFAAAAPLAEQQLDGCTDSNYSRNPEILNPQ